MKRYLALKSLFAGLLCSGLLAGCRGSEEQVSAPADTASAWRQLPSVTAVLWRDGMAVVEGVADSGARVVFTGDNDESYATSADAQGRFTVIVRPDADGILLQPRLQQAQGSVAGPGVLFVSNANASVAAVMFAGEATYRLTGSGPIDSIDSDGETLIVSGRKVGGAAALSVDGRSVSIDANSDGRWAVVVPRATGSVTLEYGGHHVVYPVVPMGDSHSGVFENGWLVRRKFSDGGVQSTWFPANK